MKDLSQDFDVLAERADDCGASWAARVERRFEAANRKCPAEWPGTLDEARGLVATFAQRAAFADRERLANIVQYAAEWAWAEVAGAPPQMHAPKSYARAG